MTDNEIMNAAELDAVTGGSGSECMALMNRLQQAGFATFITPLVAGNEKEAAAELAEYLGTFTASDGQPLFDTSGLNFEDDANSYGYRLNGAYAPITADQLIVKIRNYNGRRD